MFRTLGVTGKTLVIDVKHDDVFTRTARNIAGVKLVPSGRVTARDVMDTNFVVATREALEKLQESSDSSRPLPPAASFPPEAEAEAGSW